MTREEVIDKLKNNTSEKFIDKAVAHQDRVRFFTVTWQDDEDLSTNLYNSKFNSSIRTKYNNTDSYATFKGHFAIPFYTTDFINSLYSKLNRIFNADNAFINFAFNNANDKQQEEKNIESNLDWFKTKAWEAFKYAHNSIIIIDTDKEGNYRRDILRINNVEYIESKDNIIEEIIFTYDKKTYYAFDKDNLLVLEKKEKSDDIETLQEVKNVKNTLGKTPAVWLLNKNLNDTNEIVKESLISQSLPKCEELLISEVNNVIVKEKVVPVTTIYREDCTYDVTDEYCHEGYLIKREKIESENDSTDIIEYLKRDENGKPVPCPICNKTIIAGSTISTKKPQDDMDKDVKKNLLSYVVPPVETFDISYRSLNEIKTEIQANTLGNQELNTKLNHNEETIKYTVESTENIFNYWKSAFEKMIKDSQDIYFKVKYDNFNGSTVNLGKDYYLTTVEDVISEHEKAKANGLDQIIDYKTQFISSKFQNDPEQRQRALIIKKVSEVLRPYNDLSKQDVLELLKANAIDKKTYAINANFFDWLNRFEIEEKEPLIEMELSDIIKKFENKINEYLTKIISDDTTQTS